MITKRRIVSARDDAKINAWPPSPAGEGTRVRWMNTEQIVQGSDTTKTNKEQVLVNKK